MSLTIVANDTPSPLDGLLSRYTDKRTDAKIQVACEHGDVFEFRQWGDAEEPDRVRQEADDFAQKGVAGNVPASMAAVLPAKERTLRFCYFLAVLNTAYYPPDPDKRPVEDREPGPPYPLKDWCQIAKEVPALFDTVCDAVETSLSVIAVQRTVSGVESAKKGSRQTQAGGSNSESAEASGASTRTNSPEPSGAST